MQFDYDLDAYKREWLFLLEQTASLGITNEEILMILQSKRLIASVLKGAHNV